jgi:hypothetical protein
VYLKNNYLYRMAAAVLGIYGNSKQEAMYPVYAINPRFRIKQSGLVTDDHITSIADNRSAIQMICLAGVATMPTPSCGHRSGIVTRPRASLTPARMLT